MSEVLYSHVAVEHSEAAFQGTTDRQDTPRFLITMPPGIGDAVSVGLCVTDQIVKQKPDASGKIDVLCNEVQAELFEHDPRINKIITFDKNLLPTPEASTWMNGILLRSQVRALLQSLLERHYEAVFPGMFAPTLLYRLHTHIMRPSFYEIGKALLAPRPHQAVPIRSIARRIVDTYFGNSMTSPVLEKSISLYLCSEHVQQARAAVRRIKERFGVPDEKVKLVTVAPDTASVVTRPPTYLLAAGIAEALERDPNLAVCILPGYTDAKASENLLDALSPRFSGRVTIVTSEPTSTLLDTTAFIDQSDVFISGDTGVMHLAAAVKKLETGQDEELSPGNSTKIITLFGGTNPRFHGYSTRTTILGEGRKEQRAVRPGIVKESYNPKGRDLFDHISPQQLADAIAAAL